MREAYFFSEVNKMFEKVKELTFKTRAKVNSRVAKATGIAALTMNELLVGSASAGLDLSDKNGSNLDNTDLDTVINHAANNFISSLRRWATIIMVGVVLAALVLSFFMTDEKAIQACRKFAKGAFFTWIIIIILLPVVNWVYATVTGDSSGAAATPAPTTDVQ